MAGNKGDATSGDKEGATSMVNDRDGGLIVRDSGQDDGETSGDKYYEVKKILTSFYDRRKKIRFYKVLWKGCPRSKASYEPEDNLPYELREAYHNK